MSAASARPLVRLGLAGIGLFAVLLAVLHLVNAGSLAQHGRHVSNLVHLRGGWLWNVALVGLGGGTILLAAGLRRGLAVAGPPTWAFRALELAGVCGLLMVAFPTDRDINPGHASTLGGYLHDTFAVASTFFIAWSMVLLVSASRVDPAWHHVPGRSWLWPASTVTLALLWMGGDVTQFWPVAAVVQRAVVLVMAAWLVRMGMRMLAVEATGSGSPQPVPPPRPTR